LQSDVQVAVPFATPPSGRTVAPLLTWQTDAGVCGWHPESEASSTVLAAGGKTHAAAEVPDEAEVFALEEPDESPGASVPPQATATSPVAISAKNLSMRTV
jgi:hypothetical protein